jgi:hypothetical protein
MISPSSHNAAKRTDIVIMTVAGNGYGPHEIILFMVAIK